MSAAGPLQGAHRPLEGEGAAHEERKPQHAGEQLVLELATPEPASFANFLGTGNREAVEALTRVANGVVPETGLVIWGTPDAGKTHLLRATVRASSMRGQRAIYFAQPDDLATLDADDLARHDVVAVDDIESAEETAQATLFTLYNGLRARGAHLVVASHLPPAAMRLREDVRSRLAWGLVYEVVPLQDEEKAAALLAYARQRGFTLAPEVIRYLLLHGRRDMATLLATLAALDRHSLATKRAVTVPMLREWLQRAS